MSQRRDQEKQLDEVRELLTRGSIPLGWRREHCRHPRVTSLRRDPLKGDAEGILQAVVILKPSVVWRSRGFGDILGKKAAVVGRCEVLLSGPGVFGFALG